MLPPQTTAALSCQQSSPPAARPALSAVNRRPPLQLLHFRTAAGLFHRRGSAARLARVGAFLHHRHAAAEVGQLGSLPAFWAPVFRQDIASKNTALRSGTSFPKALYVSRIWEAWKPESSKPGNDEVWLRDTAARYGLRDRLRGARRRDITHCVQTRVRVMHRLFVTCG